MIGLPRSECDRASPTSSELFGQRRRDHRFNPSAHDGVEGQTDRECSKIVFSVGAPAREPLPEDLSKNVFAVGIERHSVRPGTGVPSSLLSYQDGRFEPPKKKMEIRPCTGKTKTCPAMVHACSPCERVHVTHDRGWGQPWSRKEQRSGM